MAGETSFLSKAFGSGKRVFRAPGRVNLIGEHTDYNLGYVLPIALEMACFTASNPASEPVLRAFSENMNERVEWPLEAIPGLSARGHWSDYVAGIAQQLYRFGVPMLPLEISIFSTVPVGSGLSSSASIEISTALALLQGRHIERKELALLAQRAEREFVGVPCGIMDQYVSVFGEAGKAIEIDCRDISHQAAPLPEGVALLAVNSMVKHALGDSAYRTRVEECAEAARILGVGSLREASSKDVDNAQSAMPDTIFRRARHVTTEDERVIQFVEASAAADLHRMGRLFLASHRSMQQDYEISCEEIDFLVDTASTLSGVYGCRMTGGGFGGCTVNLVQPNRVEAFQMNLQAAYRKRFDLDPVFYNCVPAEGAGEIFEKV